MYVCPIVEDTEHFVFNFFIENVQQKKGCNIHGIIWHAMLYHGYVSSLKW